MDPDYSQMADGVSRLGFGNGMEDNDDDILTYDTHTIGYQSNAFLEAKYRGEPVHKTGATIHGNTKTGLPFMVDTWHDSKGQYRTSIQIHLLSGVDFYKSIHSRLSTSKKEFIVFFPISKYMSRGDFAFQTFFLDGKQLTETEKKSILCTMKTHSKSSSRIKTVSRVVERTKVADFYYEQRIPLPKQCMHQLAEEGVGDDYFFGKRFVQYPDGSIHMHVELLGNVVDSYTPEELELQPVPQVASAIHGQGVTAMETESFVGGARILKNDYVASAVRTRSVKRTCTSTDPSQAQLNSDVARREGNRVLQLAEAHEQVPYQNQHAHQQQQLLQQALGDYDEDDESMLSDTAGTGPSEAVQLKQASSLQQAAAKGGHPF